MAILVYLLCAGAGYLVESSLPYSDASPFIGLLLAYHFFLSYFVVRAFTASGMKPEMTMPLPAAGIVHLAFLGAMIALVMGRDYVPFFDLVKYIVAALAPLEANLIFKRDKNKSEKSATESHSMPAGTHEEYAEFLGYLKARNRKFQRAGRSVQEEFTVWLKDRHRRPSEAPKELTRQD